MTENSFETWFKKPVAVKAKQRNEAFEVQTLEGLMKGNAGDYEIIGIKQEHYPCNKEIFEATYTKEQPVSLREHAILIEQFKYAAQKKEDSLLTEKLEKQAEIRKLEEGCVWVEHLFPEQLDKTFSHPRSKEIRQAIDIYQDGASKAEKEKFLKMIDAEIEYCKNEYKIAEMHQKAQPNEIRKQDMGNLIEFKNRFEKLKEKIGGLQK